ncbi:MAG: type 4a pilus biogenesis protein PilO [Candidatus Sedimenticola endophacoides]
MNLQELNELDLSDIGGWPMLVKVVLVLLLCTGIGIGWYFFNTEKQLQSLEQIERQELSLRKDFEHKQARAVNLDNYKKQLEEMRQSFGAMLRQLPNTTEVADLLVDVSQTGLAAGLEFDLFDPQAEVPKEFYAELPISLKVRGGYHEFGEFISGLAALPRIVTIHDAVVAAENAKNERAGGKVLTMEATVKTYRYLDEESGQ